MKIVALDELAKTCGYFYNAEWDDGCINCPNNGYNCKHPDCGEKEDGVGLCMSHGDKLSNTMIPRIINKGV